MKDRYDFSNPDHDHDQFYREAATLEKLRAGVDFDPEAVKHRGREKLAKLRTEK
jgi:hypothetical protein